MKIEKMDLVDLLPLEENVRVHNDKQIKELIRSLEQFGQTRAIVIDEDNNILIGNGLYKALDEMGETSADVYRIKGLSKTQKKKLILTDNKVYELGGTNYNSIEKYIQEITSAGDFDIAGFDENTLNILTATEEEIEEMANDYAIIPEQKVETSKEEHQVNESTSTSQTSITSPAWEQPTRNEYVAEQRRSVICPSCGEVIYID